MEKKSESKRRLNPRTILIIVLAVIVLAEGAFLLLHRPADRPDNGASAAGSAADGGTADGPDDSAGTSGGETGESGESGDGSGDVAGTTPDSGETGDGKKASDKSGGAQTPAQTPAVVIPEQNKGKPYANAVGILQNYIQSPSVATLSYLLGGELTGDQMQRFIPAVMTLSGQTFEQLQAQMTADLDLPQGATALVVTNETPLTAEQLSAAASKMTAQTENYRAISDSFREYKSYNNSEWEELGAMFGLSGADARTMILNIGDSATAMADRMDGAAISQGYELTLQAGNGAAFLVKVYCINGKWVTGAFFDTQIS